MTQIVEMLFLQTQKQRLEKTFLILTQMVSETIVASDLAKLSPGLKKILSLPFWVYGSRDVNLLLTRPSVIHYKFVFFLHETMI